MNVSKTVSAKPTVPFEEIDRNALSLVGGKAANLGEVTRAGFPVPAGFSVATAAYDLVAVDANLGPILAERTETRPDDTSRLSELVAAAGAAMLEAPIA